MQSIKKDARLSTTFISVSNFESANQLLTDAKQVLEHESGFFRIGQRPLPKELVSSLSSEVRLLTLRHVLRCQDRISTQVKALETDKPYPSNGFGYLFVYEFFEEMICHNAPPEIQSAIRTYVRESILKEDVLGKFDERNSYRGTFNKVIAGYIEERGKSNETQDLLDIAIEAGVSPEEQAEIFHRLILSTIGFTGCALEWSLIGLARKMKFINSEAFVLEILRFYSPIWRLTRKVGVDNELNGLPLKRGDRIFVNLFQINKSHKMGDSPNEFDPNRMLRADVKRNSLSFGKGRRSCPAQKPALLFLSKTLNEIHRQYQVIFRRRIFSQPRFSTFISCPSGYFKLSASGIARK